ncbi:Tyrosine-protein kinase, active site [Penicillium camemberti]|uniref:EKC/KEOPS complex subunit BUD32 n=1 Tax=Penicillium camemberti (strain FM 013) TaxID=1429867 RepID=A0A0G4PMU0_PENC3|nr:Tyrosine-protein kinase, active site [Penicillium camemberti]
MIKPEDRFYSGGQGYFGSRENPQTETHCNVWDWDQLRLIKVKGTAKLFPPDEDIENSVLAQFADYLSPEVRAITVDDDGLLIRVSTDPGEDETFFIGYVPFSLCQSLAYCSTIHFSQLQELDRLGLGVDLSSYDSQKKEMNLLSKLLPHPNVVPFDRLVLEDAESRVIGFITKYIPGGTLANADPKRPFRFEWLQQLTQVVDFLNLELGIMYQDIAPRNLLVDPETDKLLLFDFDWAANGKEYLLDSRDDVSSVVFTLYEIITNDTHFTSIPHWDRNIDMVQNID